MTIKTRTQELSGFPLLSAGETTTLQTEQTQKLLRLDASLLHLFRSVTYMQLSRHHVIGPGRNETPGAGGYNMLSTRCSNERNTTNSLAFVPNVPLRNRAYLSGITVG